MTEIAVKESNEDLERKREEEGSWSHLPVELLSLITSHLLEIDPGAIGNIRKTCKSWNLIDPVAIGRIRIPSPPPIDTTLHHHPYLMSLNGSTCKFFHPIYNHSFQMDIPELDGAFIHFSKHSWLLLSRKDRSAFFFNPFTREKITLPSLPYLHSTMSFSSVPTSSDCYVIAVDCPAFEIEIYKCGEEQWTTYKFLRCFYICFCHPVIYKERCYCLSWNGSVGVFDLKDKSSFILGKPFNVKDVSSLYRAFLVENKGELLGVFVTHEEQRVYMKRINLTKKEWLPVSKLSNKMLYVSHGACFLKPSVERGTGNKIYFPKVQQDKCIFYSLTTAKYHSFFGDYSKGIPYNIKEFGSGHCTWIEPMPLR